MKLRGYLLTVAAIVMTVGATAQNANRTDLCQYIPNQTPEQKQKIDKLSVTHQNTMDALRTQFYSESDAAKASGYKSQMNTEMKNHYQNLSALLTPEQKTWLDQNCNVNSRTGQSKERYADKQGYTMLYEKSQISFIAIFFITNFNLIIRYEYSIKTATLTRIW